MLGAGPAGLAAACALSSKGARVVVVDCGLPMAGRRTDRPEETGCGIGGAGLFSDGKFSYFPSGRWVYRLPRRDWLREAYGWMTDRLERVYIPTRPYPPLSSGERVLPVDGGPLCRRPYPSFRTSAAQRYDLLAQLMNGVNGPVLPEAFVHSIDRGRAGYRVRCRRDVGFSCAAGDYAGAVIATGKFGGLALAERGLTAPVQLHPVRYELGLRMDIVGDLPFDTSPQAADVKYIWDHGDVSFRTFCTCRDGEIRIVDYDTLTCVSGRTADVATGYSNFALLARFAGASLPLGESIWDTVISHHRGRTTATWEPLCSFMGASNHHGIRGQHETGERPWIPADAFEPGTLRSTLGEHFASLMQRACSDLMAACPRLRDSSPVCIFPAIEGTGSYPLVDGELRVPNENIWCAGDLLGHTRGIVPSLLTGYYAGLSAAERLGPFRGAAGSYLLATAARRPVHRAQAALDASEALGEHSAEVSDNATVGRSWPVPGGIASSSAPMPTVFTAQSKEHFYCRDAICEFVLSHGAVPLNPFRVFEYFLGDRVERDLIRRGNNNLVRISDQLWVFGCRIADGVLFEILLARELDKPVRFFTIDNRADRIREASVDELSFEEECYLHYKTHRATKADIIAQITGRGLLGQLSLFSQPSDEND